jgi:hypothetical protein
MRIFEWFIIDASNDNGLTIRCKSTKLAEYFKNKSIVPKWQDFIYNGNYTEVCRFQTSKGSYRFIQIRKAIDNRTKHNGLIAISNNENLPFTRLSIPNLVFLSDKNIGSQDGIEFTYNKPLTKGELSIFIKALEYYLDLIKQSIERFYKVNYQTVVNPTVTNGYFVPSLQSEVLSLV